MVSVGDVRVHAVSGRQRAPLVLIHGFPQTCGNGGTSCRNSPAGTRSSLSTCAAAGHSEKSQRGYDKASLAGDIHGTMTALALGLTHRDAVTRLMVFDAFWSQVLRQDHFRIIPRQLRLRASWQCPNRSPIRSTATLGVGPF
jgi:pimeloyl-ACP methyl ester carboxylesterase